MPKLRPQILCVLVVIGSVALGGDKTPGKNGNPWFAGERKRGQAHISTLNICACPFLSAQMAIDDARRESCLDIGDDLSNWPPLRRDVRRRSTRTSSYTLQIDDPRRVGRELRRGSTDFRQSHETLGPRR
jgi:hypothetical protein